LAAHLGIRRAGLDRKSTRHRIAELISDADDLASTAAYIRVYRTTAGMVMWIQSNSPALPRLHLTGERGLQWK
jgi:hypothetical protein